MLIRQIEENGIVRNGNLLPNDLVVAAEGSEVADYIYYENKLKNGRASCFIDGIYSQCGMCSLYDFNILEGGRMRDILEAGEKVAKWLGYTSMMITLTSDQRIRAARDYGFQEVHTFTNRRTNNTVHVLIKDVAYE